MATKAKPPKRDREAERQKIGLVQRNVEISPEADRAIATAQAYLDSLPVVTEAGELPGRRRVSKAQAADWLLKKGLEAIPEKHRNGK